MELEDLKKNWNIMEERLGHLEIESRQLKAKTINDKRKEMQKRLCLRMTIVLCFLPLSLDSLEHQNVLQVSVLTWVFLFLFIVVVGSRQFIWYWLLKKIDCMQMTVCKVYLAENRFRMAFKIGIAASALFAIPLFIGLIGDVATTGNCYMLLGVWTGLFVGLVIGIRLFLKAWRAVKELRQAVADLK